MNKRQFVLCLLTLLGSITLHAYDIEMNGVYYNITDADAKTVEVAYVETGEGNADFYYGDLVIPNRISKDGVTYTVTGIGEEAFHYCTNLTSVTIGNNVTSIGRQAFHTCTNLTSVTLPNGLLHIGYSAFDDCYALDNVVIPATATDIEGAAFSDCHSLSSVTLPEGLTSIGDYFFDNCTGLTEIVIPSTVTSIGSNAFSGCSGLTSVVIPNGVTSIGGSAFNGCSSLPSISIPSSVKIINHSAFYNCSGLTSVHITDLKAWCQIVFGDNSNYWDGDRANPLFYAKHLFLNGEEIKDLVIPQDITAIGNYAFLCCEGLTSVTIPSSVTSIGRWAFRFCTGIKSVNIPGSVQSIGAWAFSWSGLSTIKLNEGLQRIDDVSFEGCPISDIVLPASLNQINGSPFASCSNIKSVTVQAVTPPSFTLGGFPNRANATLCVPAGCKPAYEAAAYWKEFGEIIAPVGDLSELSNTKLYALSNALATLRVLGNVSISNAILDANYLGLVSNVSQLSSPYTDAVEGSLAALLDNNAETFWHSNWHDGSVPVHSHYLQVELAESVSENIYLQVTRRQANNDHITQWGVYGSNNATAADGDWEKLATIDMPYGNKSETLLSAPFDTKGYKYLRFYIDNTTGDGGVTRGYGHLSEFRLFTANDLAAYPEPVNDAYCQFALLNINDKYYLYSPAAHAFWMAQGGFCPGFGSAVTLSADDASGDYRWTLSMPLNGQTVSLCDAPLKIMPVAEFDPAEALAAFAENVDLGLADGYYRIRSAGQYTNTVTDDAGQESGERVYKYMRSSVDGSGNYYGSWSTPADLTSDLASLWKLTNRDGLFDLQNMYSQGRFTTVSKGARAMMSETSESLMAFDRVTEVDGQKILNIRVASQNMADYYYLHMEGHSGGSGVSGNIVGWRNSGSSGPSEWILEPVSDEEAAVLTSIALGDTFTAPVPCGDGTVDLTFKVTNLSPWEVEVSASPEDIAGALTIPATVQHESGLEFNVKGIGDNAFNTRPNLVSVVVPESVTVIGGSAFYGCSGLTSVAILGDLTHIWGHAFQDCTSLSDVSIHGVYEISNNVFNGCSSLKSITLPEGLMFIYDNAFRNSGLESIKFPSTLTSVGIAAFRDCHALKTIDFNNCTATVEAEAFMGTAIEELVIPETVILTGWTNFGWCSQLRSVEMRNMNQTAHNDVFKACGKLETVILPKFGVMNEGYFFDCTSLQSVTFLSGEPYGDLGYYIKNFGNVPDNQVLFTIPDGTARTYLRYGYLNLSDKSGLPIVREMFEDEATRLVAMADELNDGDKTSLQATISEARTKVNATDDYLVIYDQIDELKMAAVSYLATATLPENFDVTAAITNPNLDYFAIGWHQDNIADAVGWDEGNTFTNGDITINHYLVGWRNNAENLLADGEYCQVVKQLPAGVYRLEADAATWKDGDPEGICLFAGNDTIKIATQPESPEHFSVRFENPMTRDVKLGIRVKGSNDRCIIADNFHLIYESAAADFLLPSHTELASSETDTLYLYNVEDETFLKAGNSWGTHAVLGDEGLPVRLTQDTETGLWQVYFWEGSKNTQLMFRDATDSDEIYVDYQRQGDDLTRWAFIPDVDGTYLIQNKTLEGTDKYMGNVPSRLDNQNQYSGETHTDVIATAPSTENVHWLVMTKKQYDEYQRGLIYQNMLYADEALSVVPEGLVTLKLNLKNEASVNMTDFYLQLPEGITIVDNASGKPDVTLNSSRSNGHVVTSQRNADGIYHIVCYSSKNGAFKSNDGLLFNIKLQCAAGTAAGSYTAVLKNILMSDVNKKEITQPDYTISIEVPDLTLGDVNDDSRINGLDIVEMVDRIMQRPSDTFHFLAADLNFDSKINALDLVKLIALVLNQGVTPTTGNHAPAAGRTLQTEAEGLSLEAAADGALTMGVAAADRFILTQCVVELEEGMQLEGVTTDDSHTAVWQQLDDQRYAVLAYSTGNAAFAKNEALLSFVVKGRGHVSVTDALVVNEQREPMYLARADKDVATGIGNVNGNENVNVYDLGGRKYDDGKLHGGKLTKGVYIVNGKKMVVK